MSFWKRPVSRIYADAAAATPMSAAARAEFVRLLPLYANPGGLHQEAVAAKQELERARKLIADSIGAHADEIVFTASGTEANNLAIQGLLRPLLIKHGELQAVTSAIEHKSVLQPLAILDREGLYTTELPVDAEGLVAPGQLAEVINDETVLVSVQLVNSEVGTTQPVREIARELRRVRASREKSRDSLPLYFHIDAAQAPLWMDIKVEKLGADLMTLDAQKILGPKGVGALYIKRGTPVEPILWGGGQEGGVRSGTENVAAAGAFAVALSEAQTHASEAAARTSAVRDFLWDEIKKLVPGVLLNGPATSSRVANNLNVSVPGLESQMAVVAMDALRIAVSTRSACSAGDEEPSHVITALGVSPELAGTAIRITLLPDATRSDARRIAAALAEVTERYRRC